MGRTSKAIRLTDDDGNILDIENDHIPTIATAHQKIHDGKHFNVIFTNECTNTDEQTVIAFKTPVSGEIHLIFAASSTALATAFIYKDTSIDVGEGTEKTPQNRNQQSATVPTVLSIESTPSVGEVTTYNETQAAGANITTTTEVTSRPLGAAAVPRSIGGESRGTQEWILEADTEYAFVVNSDDNNDNIHWIELDWYEED